MAPDAPQIDDPRYYALKAELGRPEALNSPGPVDWAKAERLAEILAAERPKDLKAAAWLAAARFRRRSFAGLAQGAESLAALTAQSWAELTPPLKRVDRRLAWYDWWAEDALKALSALPPAAAPTGRELRRAQKSLSQLENALDRKAPGWGLKLKDLGEALAARRRASQALARRRLARWVGGALGLLVLSALLTLGWLVTQAPEGPDELAGHGPCLGRTLGSLAQANWPRPKVRRYWSHYDDLGRLVVYLSLEGRLPQAQVHSDLSGPRAVTALDFPGLIAPREARRAVEGLGPVNFLAWGSHPGFGRLAINYAPGQIPKRAVAQILCRQTPQGEEAAIRVAFAPGPRPPSPPLLRP
ncbi:MAG: type VI secretion system ImpA family N-terminal domain-containing protein [Deltaproteobacteria bacterium]|jgi:hypothetical protein|nr:type VI secretion system ImpA family N-terminal domain-containing protein [Deltaproteobacteria bacterium]